VRLASELEEAVVQLELSRGKAAAYDSLAAKTEKLVRRQLGVTVQNSHSTVAGLACHAE